ncbi:hypothetical protein Sa4125_29790 [Aureimonas sp. SA4125]|uniref:hypothetical protein n=1 Tax=Aureimonas sp. SA4125 TaxID=2826993 RepID=UPI001CC820E9|nr:hypothetical protein [Aureimonas sp. SA4125]BDA85437.1 hypothetical protein Sa4125_29790 [Aureimonas sp. SA4125]
MIPAQYTEIVAALNFEFFAAITPAQAEAMREASASRDGQPFEIATGVFVHTWATADILPSIITDPGVPADLDDGDLAEAAEEGAYIPGLLDEIRRRAALLTADELLSVEPFEGDDGDVRVLSSKVVRGRKEHRDHWSGMPIAAGELHVFRKELMDGEFLTTRHSRETLWLAWVGGFGASALAKQVSP